jgi:hypothetical protein
MITKLPLAKNIADFEFEDTPSTRGSWATRSTNLFPCAHPLSTAGVAESPPTWRITLLEGVQPERRWGVHRWLRACLPRATRAECKL